MLLSALVHALLFFLSTDRVVYLFNVEQIHLALCSHSPFVLLRDDFEYFDVS